MSLRDQLPSLQSTNKPASQVEEDNAKKLEGIKGVVANMKILKKKFKATKKKKVDLEKTKVLAQVEKAQLLSLI